MTQIKRVFGQGVELAFCFRSNPVNLTYCKGKDHRLLKRRISFHNHFYFIYLFMYLFLFICFVFVFCIPSPTPPFFMFLYVLVPELVKMYNPSYPTLDIYRIV